MPATRHTFTVVLAGTLSWYGCGPDKLIARFVDKRLTTLTFAGFAGHALATGVAVSARVGLSVGVAVEVGRGVGVSVSVGVHVGVNVGVNVGVLVGVGVAVASNAGRAKTPTPAALRHVSKRQTPMPINTSGNALDFLTVGVGVGDAGGAARF